MKGAAAPTQPKKPGYETLRKFLRYKNSKLNDNVEFDRANHGGIS